MWENGNSGRLQGWSGFPFLVPWGLCMGDSLGCPHSVTQPCLGVRSSVSLPVTSGSCR